MAEDLRLKVESQIDTASWDLLREHYERAALVVVHPDIDLVDVAVQVAPTLIWYSSG
ncbi:MAG: DUF2288 family protein [Bdellovibrionales bacterium]